MCTLHFNVHILKKHILCAFQCVQPLKHMCPLHFNVYNMYNTCALCISSVHSDESLLQLWLR
jgi:hypothetical protein